MVVSRTVMFLERVKDGLILYTTAHKEFVQFFERGNTFSLVVCNGCQFLI